MTTAGDLPPRFRVQFLDGVRDQIGRCQREASNRGIGAAFYRAATEIEHRLQTSPHILGEQLYDLPEARIQVRQAVIQPVTVVYGIHYSGSFVVVRDFRLTIPGDDE